MICEPCSNAADLVSLVRDAPRAETVEQAIDAIAMNVPIKDRLRTMIVIGHQECKGGSWCDCQHKIPEGARS